MSAREHYERRRALRPKQIWTDGGRFLVEKKGAKGAVAVKISAAVPKRSV